MQVLFLHGPAAAGKHTIGSALSELLGWPLFHNHLTVDLAGTLFDFGTPAFCETRAEIWRCAFRQAAKAGRSFIFTFHPEATVAPELVQQLVTIVEAEGGAVHFVELRCSREAILARLGNASRHAFGKLTDVELYAEIERGGGFDFPALPTPLVVIDTERMDAGSAAAEIEAAIRRLDR